MSETDQLGPSYDGAVMLDIGGEVGALVIVTPGSMHLVEIEISPLADADPDPNRDGTRPEHPHEHSDEHGHPHRHEPGPTHTHDHGHPLGRTHVAVRERRGPAGTRYAAIYPGLRAGRYTVWDPDGRAHRVIQITGGEVLQIDWC